MIVNALVVTAALVGALLLVLWRDASSTGAPLMHHAVVRDTVGHDRLVQKRESQASASQRNVVEGSRARWTLATVRTGMPP